jgi:hypothetical protein
MLTLALAYLSMWKLALIRLKQAYALDLFNLLIYGQSNTSICSRNLTINPFPQDQLFH